MADVYGEKFYLNKEGRVAIRPEFEPHQASDGQAHLAFFDARTQASFIWDGKSETIQVCLGGYGEPVDHEIPAPETSDNVWWASAASVVYSFEQVCRAHAVTLKDY